MKINTIKTIQFERGDVIRSIECNYAVVIMNVSGGGGLLFATNLANNKPVTIEACSYEEFNKYWQFMGHLSIHPSVAE